MKNGKPLWGLSRKGAKWAWWVFLGMCLVVAVAMMPFGYPEYEYLVPRQNRAMVEFILVTSPVLVSGVILLLSGFFAQKDEWRASLTGTGIAISAWMGATMLNMMIFRIEAGGIYTILSIFGGPILIGLIPFIHSGFIAARHDKEPPRQRL